MKTARQILDKAFRNEYSGEYRINVLTPDTVKIGKVGDNVAFEVTKGIGMDNNPIYGVTLVRLTSQGKAERLDDFSKMCESMGMVESHLDYVRRYRDSIQ